MGERTTPLNHDSRFLSFGTISVLARKLIMRTCRASKEKLALAMGVIFYKQSQPTQIQRLPLFSESILRNELDEEINRRTEKIP